MLLPILIQKFNSLNICISHKNSVNSQCPKPQAYTVTYLPGSADSLLLSMCSIENLQGLIRLQKKHKGKKGLLRERKVESNKGKGRKV
jgi:hypothetical protein